jgi:Mg2+ and Co2+ transporter CorA
VESVDLRLDSLRLSVNGGLGSSDSAALGPRLHALQSFAASFNRYLGAVRSATAGIEAVPGVGSRGAAELNDYVDQVEDVEQLIHELHQWMLNIMHDFAADIAQKQGEQINRLTLISLIFLPVTALTGFFSGGPFLILGVILP